MGILLQDLLLYIKNDRRVWTAVGFLIVSLVIFSFTQEQEARWVQKVKVRGATTYAREVFVNEHASRVHQMSRDLKQGKMERQQLGLVIDRTSKELKDHTQQTSNLLDTLIFKFDNLSEEIQVLSKKVKVDRAPRAINNRPLRLGQKRSR